MRYSRVVLISLFGGGSLGLFFLSLLLLVGLLDLNSLVKRSVSVVGLVDPEHRVEVPESHAEAGTEDKYLEAEGSLEVLLEESQEGSSWLGIGIPGVGGVHSVCIRTILLNTGLTVCLYGMVFIQCGVYSLMLLNSIRLNTMPFSLVISTLVLGRLNN